MGTWHTLLEGVCPGTTTLEVSLAECINAYNMHTWQFHDLAILLDI